jgi:predicted DNA-binding transcriptional regulator YafY
MDMGTSVERQLYILSLLAQSAKGYTLNEIIDHLRRVGIEATRRMVSRDVDSISRNFFVYEEEKEGKILYKADRYAVKNMDFTMHQIISLYYLKEMLGENQQLNIAGEAVKIIDRILEQMPALSKAALSDIEDMIKIVPMHTAWERDVDDCVLEDVRRATQNRTSVDILYTPFMSGKTQLRRFDPYVLEVRDGCWHAIGFCHLRGAIRDLRLARMESVKPTEERFDVPRGFYEGYRRMRFDKLAGEEARSIVIEFSGEAARLIEEYHATKADRFKRDGDRLLFYKKAALTPDLTQWVLSFGAEARVIKPKELAACVADLARLTAALYEKPEQTTGG